MDCYGDQILTCSACMSDRTSWHDLIDDVVARMARTDCHANIHVALAHSARRPRAASLAYSPNWRPELTFLHAARDGNFNHMIADVTCPYLVTQTDVPATSHMPLAAAIKLLLLRSIVSMVMSSPTPCYPSLLIMQVASTRKGWSFFGGAERTRSTSGM